MADKAISAITNSLTNTTVASADVFVVVDTDASETKKITAGNLVMGTQDMWVPAPAMTVAVNTPAAAIASIDSGALGGGSGGDQNITVPSIAFAGADADTMATFNVAFPKSWNASTITAQFIWTNSDANAGNVVWAIQGLCVVDDGALNTTMGTAVTVQDANITTAGDLMVSAATSAVTIAGAAAAGICFFNVYRDASDETNDTYATNAHLIGVKINYTTSAATDA